MRPPALEAHMTPLQSFILGIIEGITEYLPVSSTGHLIVAQRLMGLGTGTDKEASDAFAICIQGGAIAAVLGLYWPRVLQMIRGGFGKDAEGLRLVVAMICGFLPAAVLGLTFNSWIKQHLFGLVPVVIAWIAGGVAILVVARFRKRRQASGTQGVDLAEITWKMALIIGFMQCVAMWPGTSRSPDDHRRRRAGRDELALGGRVFLPARRADPGRGDLQGRDGLGRADARALRAAEPGDRVHRGAGVRGAGGEVAGRLPATARDGGLRVVPDRESGLVVGGLLLSGMIAAT
jgi:hypothetical protein